MISSKLLCTDVLAIQCIDKFVFVGIGYILHIFNRHTSKLEKKINALYPYNIHGIVQGLNNKLIVYGANSVHAYNVCINYEQIELHKLCSIDHLHDWVITVKWLPVDNFFNLVILFAHNDVKMYNILNERTEHVYCNARCILYGGSILIKENKDIVIFSGTVFQEILIWEIKWEFPILKNVPILHRLTGHNGVIFSIVYDPSTHLICSTSDDRTIRLWEVIDKSETPVSEVNWRTAKIKLTRTMYGHTARVWRSLIRNRTLITIGEDAMICVWSLTGKLLNKIHGRHGAAIWSMDISKDDGILLTGGGDGEIRLLPLETEKVRATISLPIDNSTHASPKYISYLNSGALLVYHDDGHLLCYDEGNADQKKSLYFPRSSCYFIMQISPCRCYASFASNDGYVAIYKERRSSNTFLEQVFEGKVMETRILSLHWLGNDRMVVCGIKGVLKVFNFTIREGLRLQSVNLLPHSHERWLIAAILYKKELLVCADRAGNIHVYDLRRTAGFLNSQGNETETSPRTVDSVKRPVQSLPKVHGRIGVQTFTILNESRLMSAGRDGILRFYELQISPKNGTGPLRMLHKEKMPMDWIGKTIEFANDILILGFKEAEFIVYSMSDRRVLARILCGGGHRSWDCVRSAEGLTFAYIRSKQIFTYNCELQSSKYPAALLNGFHAKETYCVQAVTEINGQTIFLSGGEDTTVRVTCVSRILPEGTYKFHTLGIFDGHVSSIKCMTSVKVHENAVSGIGIRNSCLVFSAGGRAQIKVWEIAISESSKTEITSKDVSCTDVTSHLLAGLDQRRRKPWQDTVRSYEIQPETRYMDIDGFRLNESMQNILIFVGCADGRLRTFVYNTNKQTMHLKATIRYVDRCILKISVLPRMDRTIVLTMSTDGMVRFFDLTEHVFEILKEANDENLEKREEIMGIVVAEFGLHQSGINSFDLKVLGKGEYMLATGGDDNLFSLAIFQVSVPTAVGERLSVVLRSSWSSTSAHSAQITGIRFKDGQNKVCSVGVDQQVVIYEYEYLKSKIVSVKIVDQTYTAVPDVQGMVLLPPIERKGSPLVCIYGKGFEIFAFE